MNISNDAAFEKFVLLETSFPCINNGGIVKVGRELHGMIRCLSKADFRQDFSHGSNDSRASYVAGVLADILNGSCRFHEIRRRDSSVERRT